MKVPNHIALIPDGNRRWAQERGIKPWEGHGAGIKKFREFLNWCCELGTTEVTAYSLSKENLEKRSSLEMKFLFELYKKNLVEVLKSPEVEENQMSVRFVGNLDALPKRMNRLMAEIEEETAQYSKRRLNLCVNYSGREEIINAINTLDGLPITAEKFEQKLWVKGSPDLLIRTAESRISNFLLWQCAYSEIYFCQKLFPDFEYGDFAAAIKQFNQTKRKYGK
jgi:undecaprenyl diphosphate synthase